MVKNEGFALVEPVGYDQMWQRFENDVYQMVKTKLENRFRVEWCYEIRNGLKPDVVALLECRGCYYQREPCLIPSFIFDAYCKFKIEKNYFLKKVEQMKKYSNICDSILVMPQGYENRPYCKSKDGVYHIISFHYLPIFLNSINEAVVITLEDDVCGSVPSCDAQNVYKHFELSVRSKVDKCPDCKAPVFPVSLIHCSKYDEYFYSDFLDTAEIEHGITDFTYVECDGCGDSRAFGWNYNECAYSSLEYKYQCKKCGAVFDPETNKIIENFEETHLYLMAESFPYYERVRYKNARL
jgi:ribosomal protein S27E